MMLRPEHLQAETLLPRYTDLSSIQANEKTNSSIEAPEMNQLINSLIPENISPAKRAVIERLAALWVSESNLDVA